MRDWYHTDRGLSADLCQMLGRESTRLIIRDPEHTVFCCYYPTWQAAIDALMTMGDGWISDLTGKVLV